MATATSTTPEIPVLGSKSFRRQKAVGRLGPWQLLQLLGEGALTRVYLARSADCEGSSPAYAVKSLRKEWWSEPQAIEAQRREAWVGQRVNHPNLVPILSAGVTAPPFYVVMPRLEGETADRLLARGPIRLPIALWIARQAAEALAALHAATGMLHNDVKPSNLVVGPDGHTTLIDFGFCQTEEESRSWADRPVVGTLHYLAPERLTSSTASSVQSDLYSLGVTLYELIAGERPFEAEHPAQLIALHRESRPTDLRETAAKVPESVAQLVTQLLAKDPLRRPGNPRQLADALRKLEIESFGLR